MTEGEAQKKLESLFMTLEHVYERFDKNYFDGAEIYSTIKEIGVLANRFIAEVEERNGNERTTRKHG